MEIYLKITRDLYEEGTLQIGKETVHFNKKYFHFLPYFYKIKRLHSKNFYYSQKLCNTILYKISTIFAFVRRAASIYNTIFQPSILHLFCTVRRAIELDLYNILIYSDKLSFCMLNDISNKRDLGY